ncbi:MAG: hypothetical protein IJZ36_02935 [Bacilli bacterium]|nr:hypothetical protein [Bacilli bacterium]
MRYLKLLLFFFLLLPISISAKENVKIYLFHSETCMHCQAEIKYLESIKDDYSLDITYFETSFDAGNKELGNKVWDKLKIKGSYQTPFTIIGNTYFIGFDEEQFDYKSEIVKAIENYNGIDVVDKIINDIDISDIEMFDGVSGIASKYANAPIFLMAIVLGALDGFNPCAMWVLIFLTGMLLNMKNKKRMWILGVTFITTSALVYLLFMLAWLNIAVSVAKVNIIRYIIGLLALVIGVINIKNYIKSLKKDDGCHVVKDSKRKKIFTFIKKVVSNHSFILSILGIIALAFSVNVIELACSAGIPLIFTQILALNNLSMVSYIFYMLIYILFFLIDDLIVFIVAMVTLNVTGISTKYTKYSHLIGGIVMVLIALLMIFKPDWLMLNIK